MARVTMTNVKTVGSVAPASDHININTVLSTKSVRINCRTYTVYASIIGMQCKPRAGVNMVNDCIGAEFEPGVDAGFTSTQGIVALKANPVYRGSSTSRGGDITGDIRGIECQLGGNSFGTGWTSTRTIGGTISVLKAINDVHATAVTGGIFVIHVAPIAGGDKAWSGLVKLPDDGQIATASGDKSGGTKGWIKCVIGSSPYYIQAYAGS